MLKKNRQMGWVVVRILPLFFIMSITVNSYAEGSPDGIDFFSKERPISGNFMGIQDPGPFVKIKVPGGIIESSFEGISWETLYEWEKESKETGRQRAVSVKYSLKQGVFVHDVLTGSEFRLVGVVSPHPIDWSGEYCRTVYESMSGFTLCASYEAEAWAVEVKRAYSQLGRNDDPLLEKMHDSWMKYELAAKSFLVKEASTGGTISNFVLAMSLAGIRKDYAQFLYSCFENR